MRRDARVDANQAEIASALRQLGCTVQSLAAVGDGCPDLLVGRNGRNYLLEIKTQTGKLETMQRIWHKEWRGQKTVVRTVDEAIAVIQRG